MLEMSFVFMPKLTILEVTEISQGCVVWLKGVCVETTGFRIRRDRERPHRT